MWMLTKMIRSKLCYRSLFNPHACLDVYGFYVSNRFQGPHKPTKNFKDDLPIRMFVEVADGAPAEFEEDADGSSIRNWCIVPKRLFDGVNIDAVRVGDNETINVAEIG